MPILSTDLTFRYSVSTGPGGSNSQPNPNISLGGFVSSTQWSGGTLNDLFDDITGDENAAMQVDYRCIFIQNNNATLTLLSPVLWISSEVSGGATIALGIDPTATSIIASSSQQALLVGSSLTAPGGVTFSSPMSKGAGLSLGDLPAGQVKAFWFQRTATNSAALNNDGVTIEVSGSTAA